MARHEDRYPVIEAFVKGKAKRDSSNMWTDGSTLYSYRMPLARRVADSHVEVLVSYDECPTATTKYHHRSMMQILRFVQCEEHAS